MVKPLTSSADKPILLRTRPQVFHPGVKGSLSTPIISNLDERLFDALRRRSIPALRVALGLIFIWFGALKVFGVSPILGMLKQTYAFLPLDLFVLVLGGWEMLIGVGLILKRALRCMLVLLCMHLTGTFLALCLAPTRFFLHGIPLILTADGEFVMKNIVLVAAVLVIGGHEVKPLRRNALVSSPSLTEGEKRLVGGR
jgi:uncharacterized membrane protein YkgB